MLKSLSLQRSVIVNTAGHRHWKIYRRYLVSDWRYFTQISEKILSDKGLLFCYRIITHDIKIKFILISYSANISVIHRSARLVTQQTSITDYHLSFGIKENKLPFSVTVCSKQTEIAVSPLVPFFAHTCVRGRCACVYVAYLYLYWYLYEYLYLQCICCHFKGNRETEAQAIFLNLFTVCSSC